MGSGFRQGVVNRQTARSQPANLRQGGAGKIHPGRRDAFRFLSAHDRKPRKNT